MRTSGALERRGHLRPRSSNASIAVNTDSLEIWVLEALAQLHHQHGYLFDVRVDDQEYTLDLLRQGAVLGAIARFASRTSKVRFEVIAGKLDDRAS